MNDPLRVFVVYDWLDAFDMAKHPEILVKLVDDAGVHPNKASFYFSSENKERRRTIFKKTKLIDVIAPFKNYDGVSLDEIINGNFLNLRSHLDYGTGGSKKLYVVARIPTEFMIADALRNLRLVCKSLTPRYGFSNIGDGASAIFATTGNPTTSLPYDVQKRISDLGHFLYERQYLTGKLHDVYELNVLNPLHLEAKIRGWNLKAWIESSTHGELVKIKNEVFVWLVPDDIRPAVRHILFKEGLLGASI